MAGPCLDRYPRDDRTLSRLLRDRAAADPNRTWVVIDGREVLTLGAVFATACRVASALGRDARPRPRVGLMLGTRAEMVDAFHGVLLAGGIAVPLNPELRGQHRDAVLARAGLHAIVADHASVVALTDAVLPDLRIVVGATAAPNWVAWEAWLPAGAASPDRMPGASDPAVVMFTSGTTGTPKGAVCSHHYTYAYGAMVSDSLERGPEDVLTTPMPLFHSGGLHVVVHSALHAGARAHVKSRFSAGRYWDQVAEDGATQGLLVGPMAEMVLRQPGDAPPHRMEIASISAFGNRAEFERRYRVRVLWQGYGMTEVYPIPMAREMIVTPHDDTIGIPVDAYHYGVVDEGGVPLGPGEVGELVVRPRDPGFAFDGYLDDPGATGTAWRGGAFHTGDLASYDDGGVLRYRGRRGDRIRRRGENIDPIEVEATARTHPAVRDAAAYGVPSDLGDSDVKLDLVLDAPVELGDLHTWLSSSLARHAVPRYLEVVTLLPRNASLRVERARLAARPVNRPEVFDAELEAEDQAEA